MPARRPSKYGKNELKDLADKVNFVLDHLKDARTRSPKADLGELIVLGLEQVGIQLDAYMEPRYQDAAFKRTMKHLDDWDDAETDNFLNALALNHWKIVYDRKYDE